MTTRVGLYARDEPKMYDRLAFIARQFPLSMEVA